MSVDKSGWVYTVFLIDGTQLSQDEWEKLAETGEVQLKDRVLTRDPEMLAREKHYLADMLAAFDEIKNA
jgi:hypothetical protein